MSRNDGGPGRDVEGEESSVNTRTFALIVPSPWIGGESGISLEY